MQRELIRTTILQTQRFALE